MRDVRLLDDFWSASDNKFRCSLSRLLMRG